MLPNTYFNLFGYQKVSIKYPVRILKVVSDDSKVIDVLGLSKYSKMFIFENLIVLSAIKGCC